MKCPYRMNEIHTCHNGKTFIYMEYAECYGKVCPYFGTGNNGGWCWKVMHEVKHCDYQEVN